MITELKPCGTYGAAQRHARRKEPLCDPCQAARTAYMAERRATDPKAYKNEQIRNAARSRALWRLADQFSKHFENYYIEEVNKVREEAS